MTKVFVSTIPFALHDGLPLDLLIANGCDVEVNPTGEKLTGDSLKDFIGDTEVLIAGTESITEQVLNSAPKLKLICRVGIGLDSVDLTATKNKGILVSHTPDAPSPAVAELTIGLMLDLLRKITASTENLRSGNWERVFGRRLDKSIVALIGFGRIGQLVALKLIGLGVQKNNILVDDVDQVARAKAMSLGLSVTSKDHIYRSADIISLHLPLDNTTSGLIGKDEIEKMRPEVCLINTSRGGIIDEAGLYDALIQNEISGAAIDVFENEPYYGNLINCDNAILTAHMGSMTLDCRSRMELEACEEACRFLAGDDLLFPAWQP